MEFEGKRVLITGASRGIGRALAERFLREGARVAVNGRDAARLEAAASEIGAEVAVPGDLSTAATCEAVVREALATLGGLDILVNNAGMFSIASIPETDEAAWDAMFGANLKSAFFTSRAALDALRAARGVILNHASIAGLIGLANVSAYCASKGAMVHLTRAMAMELAPEIRVNCVCPTTVDNELGRSNFSRAADPEAARAAFIAAGKLKRMPTNDDVVEAFLYLASPRASFLTGVALPVDGGKSAGV